MDQVEFFELIMHIDFQKLEFSTIFSGSVDAWLRRARPSAIATGSRQVATITPPFAKGDGILIDDINRG